MYTYIFILMILTIVFSLARRCKKSAKYSAILLLLSISIAAGIRFNVGVDYMSYYEGFYTRFDKFGYELLYSLLQYYIKIWTNNFSFLTLIMSFLTSIFIHLGLKKRDITYKYYAIAILVYTSNIYFVFMNIMRTGLAAAILFYALCFLNENRRKFLVLCLIASLFHYSALIAIPLMYFARKVKYSLLKFVGLVCISVLLVQSGLIVSAFKQVGALISEYARYTSMDKYFSLNPNPFSIGVFLNVIAFMLLLIVSKDTKDEDVSLYMFGIIMNILSSATFLIDRVGIYFFIFSLAAIPKLISRTKNKELRVLSYMLVISVTLLMFVSNAFINAESLHLEYQVYTEGEN